MSSCIDESFREHLGLKFKACPLKTSNFARAAGRDFEICSMPTHANMWCAWCATGPGPNRFRRNLVGSDALGEPCNDSRTNHMILKNEIEDEKRSGNIALEKMSEELAKLVKN